MAVHCGRRILCGPAHRGAGRGIYGGGPSHSRFAPKPRHRAIRQDTRACPRGLAGDPRNQPGSTPSRPVRRPSRCRRAPTPGGGGKRQTNIGRRPRQSLGFFQGPRPGTSCRGTIQALGGPSMPRPQRAKRETATCTRGASHRQPRDRLDEPRVRLGGGHKGTPALQISGGLAFSSRRGPDGACAPRFEGRKKGFRRDGEPGQDGVGFCCNWTPMWPSTAHYRREPTRRISSLSASTTTGR